MSNSVAATKKTTPLPAHLEELFRELDPPKTRVILALDATASRQPTWDMAAGLTSQMVRAAAGSGGLELQFVYYRGERECTASRWMSNASALVAAMSGILCKGGYTQIERVMKHVQAEDQRQKVAAVILVSDSCEEDPKALYAAARTLNGVPVFLFQEGHDESVAGIYRTIANITGGAWAKFDAGAAARLADLLKAVVAFATGGRKALTNQNTDAARKLLTQIKK